MKTRPVNILNQPAEIMEYTEYLAANGWPVVRTRIVDDGRYLQITFAW